MPVERAAFVSPSLIAYTTKDRKSYLLYTDTKRQIKLDVSDDSPQINSNIDSRHTVSDSLSGGVVALLNLYNAGKY